MGDWFDSDTDFSAWGSDSNFGGFDAGMGFDNSWLNSYITPDFMANSGSAPGVAGPAFTGMGPMDQMLNGGNPFAGSIAGGASPLLGGALGAAGPLVGLLGSLASGGQTGQQMPKIGSNAQAMLNTGANQVLQPFAQGQSPLQMQQAGLLQAIAGGQGLAQPYAQAIEQAFQPQMGSLYDQAVQAGRARGFYDAPATSPPGGAILGPGLADLQGQIAAAKIAQMNALPGLFQQPINTQAMAAGQQSNALLGAAGQQIGQTNSVPMGAQVGQGLAGVLGGASAGYNATQQANQQSQFQNSLLSALRYPGYGA